jgi:hypothetical protein
VSRLKPTIWPSAVRVVGLIQLGNSFGSLQEAVSSDVATSRFFAYLYRGFLTIVTFLLQATRMP